MAGPKMRLLSADSLASSCANFWGELQQTDSAQRHTVISSYCYIVYIILCAQTLDLERPRLVSKVFFLYEMMTTASDVSFKNIFLPARRFSLDIMVLANSYNDLSQNIVIIKIRYLQIYFLDCGSGISTFTLFDLFV